jgi:hypothetical protein
VLSSNSIVGNSSTAFLPLAAGPGRLPLARGRTGAGLTGPRSHLAAEVLHLPHELLELLLHLPKPLLRPRPGLAAPGSARAALRRAADTWTTRTSGLRAATTALRRAAGAGLAWPARTTARRAAGTSWTRRTVARAPHPCAPHPHQFALADFDAPDFAPVAVLHDDNQDAPPAAVRALAGLAQAGLALLVGDVQRALAGLAQAGLALLVGGAQRALAGLAGALLGRPQPLFRDPQLLAGALDFAARLAHVTAPVGRAPVLGPAPARWLALS